MKSESGFSFAMASKPFTGKKEKNQKYQDDKKICEEGQDGLNRDHFRVNQMETLSQSKQSGKVFFGRNKTPLYKRIKRGNIS